MSEAPPTQDRTPAERVIEKCGGLAAVAKMAGVHITRVHRWAYPKGREGGTDGRIPTKHQQVLLDRARDQGIDLKPSDFFEPAPASQDANTSEAA